MQRGNQDFDLANQTIIYLGLIPFEWNEENLKAVVCSLGTVLDIHFSMDHVGKNKGYAFIEYQTPQQAKNAIAVLLQSQFKNPMTGYFRRFKADLSKEPNKNSHITNRPPIIPNMNAMPQGMQFPPDFVPQITATAPPPPSQNQYSQQAPEPYNQAVQRPNNMNTSAQAPPPPPPNKAMLSELGIPEKFLKATEALPIPVKLPFATPDKISETLSLLPPAELIQLLANLKAILASGDMTRAADVFQLSPQLATAATQALLLMGFIDEGVIQDTMKSGGALPTAAQPMSQPPNNFQNKPYGQELYGAPPPMNQSGPQSFNRAGYGNYPQQNYPQQGPPPQNHRPQSGYSRGYNQPPTGMQNGNQSAPLPPPSSQSQGRWPNLPPSAQMKLANLAPNEAQVIAEVLLMPMEQINQLAPDRQNVIMTLRQQYM